MRKGLLILVSVLLYAGSAFAWGPELDIKAIWFGDAMVRGTYVSNADGTNNPKDKFFFETDFNFGVALKLNDALKITVRASMFDSDMGRLNERWDRTYQSMADPNYKDRSDLGGNPFEIDDNFRIERAFITYNFGWGDKKPFQITAGRLFSAPYGHNYGKEFGRRDGVILQYKFTPAISLQGFYYARKETSGRDAYAIGKSNMDWHTYGAVAAYFDRNKDGMNLFTAAIDINNNPSCDSAWTNEPCISEQEGRVTPVEIGNKRNMRYFASLYGSMRKNLGFSWIAEVMLDYRTVKAATSERATGTYALWGAIVEPWYDWQKFRLGARLTYASYSDSHGKGFDWGGEYVTTGANIQDTMDIVHDWLFDYRLAGINMAQINGMWKINPKWELKAFASFFFSSIQDSDNYVTGNNVTAFSGRDTTAFGKSTTAMELDLNLRYNIMPRTYIDLGYAYFQMWNRVQPQIMSYPEGGRPIEVVPFAARQSSDPINMVYLRMMIQY